MTIDLTLFRAPHEGGNVQDIYEWQKVRLPEGDSSASVQQQQQQQQQQEEEWNHIQSCVANVEKWDLQRRHTQTTLNDTRSALKSLQQSLAPRSKQQQRQRHQQTQSGNNKSLPNNNDTNDIVNPTNKESIRQQIQHLKTQVIPDLEQSLNTITLHIEQTLPLIANIVDHDIHDKLQLQEQESTTTTRTNTNNNHHHHYHHHVIITSAATTVMDPLYCLGGYETYSWSSAVLESHNQKHKKNGHNSGSSSSKPGVVLSGIGAELHHALRCTSLSILMSPRTSKTTTTPKYQLLQLPESVHIPTSLIHNLWGCRHSAMPSLSPSSPTMSLSSSSLTSFSLLHAKKSYQDRELPLFFVNQSTITTSSPSSRLLEHTYDHHTTTPSSSSVPITPVVVEDDRPSQLFQENSTTTTTTTTTWIDQLSSSSHTTQMDMFALTACSMDEAQRVQLQMVQQIIDFHQSLLLPLTTRNEEEKHQSKPLLRTRIESPWHLLPCEASRIVIEGYLPPPSLTTANTTKKMNKKNKKNPTSSTTTVTGDDDSYVVLGYVSNFTDYLSRPCQTKYGTSAKGKDTEFVYTVHGILTRLSSTMNWMIVNNTVSVAVQPLPTTTTTTTTTTTLTPRQQLPYSSSSGGTATATVTAKKSSADNAAVPPPPAELGIGIPCCSSSSKRNVISLATMLLHDQSSCSMDKHTNNDTEEELDEDDGAFLFLPFQRRIHHGKNGKIRYEELKSSNNNRRIIPTGRIPKKRMTSMKSPHAIATSSISISGNEGTTCTSSPTTTAVANPSPFPIFGQDRMPTTQEIENEACTNPYNGFLPFYH